MAVASLYRRSLTSPPAIDFSSTDGKVRINFCLLLACALSCCFSLQNIFKEAVQKGTMEGYFSLISYFQTLSEPAFSGLASLSVVLNALSIDSDRKWKGIPFSRVMARPCIEASTNYKPPRLQVAVKIFSRNHAGSESYGAINILETFLDPF